LGPEPVPDPEPTPGKAVGGGAAEYALIVGVISLGATAGGWLTLDPPKPCGCPILRLFLSKGGNAWSQPAILRDTYDAAGHGNLGTDVPAVSGTKHDCSRNNSPCRFSAANFGGWPTLDPPAPCGCPILSAVSSRKGWETTNFDRRLFGLLRAEVTLSYTYYPTGKVQTITSSNPNGASVAYTYDDLNRLGTVVDNRLSGNTTTNYAYDQASNLSTATYPNGVQSIITYDALNRITGLATQNSGYIYQRGPTGNLANAVELNNRTVQWSYDGINRLTNETITNDPGQANGSVAYQLDPVGNRLSETSSVAGIASGSFGYNADDEVNTETYDANGNTLFTGGKNFTYDAENHLTSMSTAGTTVSIVYDAFGNRVAKTVNGVTTKYLVDDLNPTGYAQVFDELTNGVVTRTYTYGLQRISEDQIVNGGWTPSFYGYDGGGNLRQLTNMAGAVTDTFEYDAFGNKINATGTTPNNYLYRGEQFDPDLGLYYLRARYYNPATGRFVSRDPEDGIATDPATLHKYDYAGGDPVNLADPTGRTAATATWGGSASEYIGIVTIATLQAASAAVATDIALECAYQYLSSETTAYVALGLAGDGDSGTVTRTGACSVKEDDHCREQYDEDIDYCAERYPPTSRGRQYCIARAKQNYNNCLAGLPRQPLDPMHPKWRTD